MGTRNPAAPQPTRVRFVVLGVGCSLAVVAYIHRVGFASALPRLELDADQKSWMTAVFQLAYGLFEIPAGLLGDRFGTRHLITVLVLGWSLVTGLVAVTTLLPEAYQLPLLFLLTVRFLFGMFQAGGFPLLARMLTDWLPVRERGGANGAVWMASRAGGLIAPYIFLYLATGLGGWQPALWALAGLGVFWCAGFWPWFRNRPEEVPAVNEAERQLILSQRAPRAAGHSGVPWRRMLRSRSVWGLLLLYGCCGFASNFYVTLLPTWLSDVRRLDPDTTTRLTSLPFGCGMATCLLGGMLSDFIIRRTGNRRWGRRAVGLTGLGLGAFGWLAINAVGSGPAAAPMLAVVLCVVFMCNDLNMGPAWAACADIGEGYAGTIGGAMNMGGAVLGAVGNLIAGVLFTRGQPEVVFVIYGVVYGVGALGWLLVDVTRPV